jgi:hypothetical protein
MMRITRLLGALCFFGPLSLEVSAAESPAQTGGVVASANARQAAGGTTPGRVTTINSGHAVVQAPNRGTSSKDDAPKGRNASAPAPRRGAGPQSAAARGNVSAGGTASPRAGLQSLATRRLATSPARVRPSVNAMVRGSMIGGPRAAAPGRLGGPAAGRTANNTAAAGVDGSQLHHKF